MDAQRERRRARQRAPRASFPAAGLAYWTDGREERIIYVTPGYRMVALNAKTGSRSPRFGKNGIVDLKEDDDQAIDPMSPEIGLHAAPIVDQRCGDHRRGAQARRRAHQQDQREGLRPRDSTCAPASACGPSTPFPSPANPGSNTWEKDSWSYTGNTGSWGQMSVDEELGLVYIGVELPTGDYYGGHRPGNNLFGESMVAVDLKTGKVKWHYQYVHHGIWDMDNPCPPILADIIVNGRTVKAVAQPTKQAFLYVLNRETGEPIWPIVEKPVAKGDVPGEWYSPTQPFPTKPPAYDRQGIVDRRSDRLHARAASRSGADRFKRYKIGPMFTPGSLSKPEGPLATLTLATAGGGSNWPGGSYDPETHIVYVSSQAAVTPDRAGARQQGPDGYELQSGTAAPAAGRGRAVREHRPVAGYGGSGCGRAASGDSAAARWRWPDGQGLPLIKPPYGQISAIDLNKGEILWQVAHGETPDNIRDHPALKGMNIPRTGRPGTAGTLVTKTLVIVGEKGTVTHAERDQRARICGHTTRPPARTPARFHARAADRLADDLYRSTASNTSSSPSRAATTRRSIARTACPIKTARIVKTRPGASHRLKSVIPILAYAAAHLDEDLSLAALASQTGLSQFQLHRMFSATAGETLKQFTLRLRLGRAAVMLLAGGDSVLDIALACGFQSHEVFIRAFRQRFEMTPTAYRARGFVAGAGKAAATRGIGSNNRSVRRALSQEQARASQRREMPYSITKKELSPQPVLVLRRKVKPPRSEPRWRRFSVRCSCTRRRPARRWWASHSRGISNGGPGLVTIEAGLPVAAAPREVSEGEGVRRRIAGRACGATTHTGPYDKLCEAHAAVEVWIEEQGLTAAGAPWEIYTTDPADHPDPKDWKTDIFWPLT